MAKQVKKATKKTTSSKKTNKTINDLDSFLDYLDESVLTYKNGIKNYLEGNKKEFDDNLENITRLRDITTDLRRTMENELYTYSLVSDQRVEIMQLLERLDGVRLAAPAVAAQGQAQRVAESGLG